MMPDGIAFVLTSSDERGEIKPLAMLGEHSVPASGGPMNFTFAIASNT
jgi:hypothetical protein